MGINEDINRYYQEGKSEQDIALLLQQQGYANKDISDSLSQSKIKQAVSSGYEQPELAEIPQPHQEMQQSVMSTPAQEYKAPEKQSEQPQESQAQYQENPQSNQVPQQQEQYPQEQYAAPQYAQQQYQQDNSQYDQYQQYSQTSSDSISEIAEQVFSEKLSPLKDKLDTIIDMRNSFDSRISSIDDRLKRLEKIIDRLQLSILQKVGEYVSNVEDIKKEMVESQKSFKALLSKQDNYKQL